MQNMGVLERHSGNRWGQSGMDEVGEHQCLILALYKYGACLSSVGLESKACYKGATMRWLIWGSDSRE